jgi:hypothetical protein
MLKSELELGEAESIAAMVTRLATTGDPAAESVWTFGFGSNMNVALLRSKKGLGVLDSAAGAVAGWHLSFKHPGMGCVEPSWAAALRATPEDVAAGESTIHGVRWRV